MRINYMGVRLVKENGVNYADMISINSPSSVAKALNNLFELEYQAKEKMVMMMLDTKHKVLAVSEISVGTVNSSLVTPREVFQMALLQGAVSIVLAHNHPSGNTSPSPEDINVTKRIKDAGEVVGVKLLDHIIIGDCGRYTSLKEEEYI